MDEIADAKIVFFLQSATMIGSVVVPLLAIIIASPIPSSHSFWLRVAAIALSLLRQSDYSRSCGLIGCLCVNTSHTTSLRWHLPSWRMWRNASSIVFWGWLKFGGLCWSPVFLKYWFPCWGESCDCWRDVFWNMVWKRLGNSHCGKKSNLL